MNISKRMLLSIYSDEFSAKSIRDAHTRQYYNLLCRSVDQQLEAFAKQCRNGEFRNHVYEESKIREAFFEEMSSEVDRILENTNLSASAIIDELYNKGAVKGFREINRALSYSPQVLDALDILKEYNFDLIRDVSNSLVDGIRATIQRGLLEGSSNYEMGKRISELGLEPLPGSPLSPYKRGLMIARTESNRVENQATLQSYATYGVEKVDVINTGNDPCEECIDIADNNPYTLEEAEGLLPVHPNCECTISAHFDYSLSLVPVDDPVIVDLVPA